MKVIQQSVEILDTLSPYDVYDRIELAARTCYKSQPALGNVVNPEPQKQFWYLKWLPEDGEKKLFIVDGNEDIVFSADCFIDGDANEIEKDYWVFQKLQEICNEHNKTHLEDKF